MFLSRLIWSKWVFWNDLVDTKRKEKYFSNIDEEAATLDKEVPECHLPNPFCSFLSVRKPISPRVPNLTYGFCLFHRLLCRGEVYCWTSWRRITMVLASISELPDCNLFLVLIRNNCRYQENRLNT